MKLGDTVYCKKDFYLPTYQLTGYNKIFESNNQYKIINITVQYWKPLGDCLVLELENNGNTNYIPERIFLDYFYSKQEVRKQKLLKINDNI